MLVKPADVTALPAGVESPGEFDGEWVVAQVRGLFERQIAAVLIAADVPYYLPMERVIRRRNGRRTEVDRLLFNSYLFACCRHDDDKYELVARDGVLKIIKVKDQPRIKSELSAISLATRNGLLRDPAPDIQPGRQCEIVRGPLRGCKGWIDKRESGRVMLCVTILGTSRPVDVPIEDVELM